MWNPLTLLTARLFRKELQRREVFALFREVLKGNNQTLEAITDLGEKLGGDYLFDIRYVSEAAAAVIASINDTLKNFDALTRGRYPQLAASCSRIEAMINRAISDTVEPAGPLVVAYKDVSWDMAGALGGKNASLAEAKNSLGVAVPPAFAITTHAYDEFMQEGALEDDIRAATENQEADEGRLAALRSRILGCQVPERLLAAIDDPLARLRKRAGPSCFLAVRSSAQEEDGELSFAGQFNSILNVPAEKKAVADAYKQVTASLFTSGAVTYQHRFGFAPGAMKMAACCIVMVNAIASGVSYSASPAGDTGVVLINGSWGLGSSIVEGRVDTDSFTVKKTGKQVGGLAITERRLGGKQTMVVRQEGGGTATVDTPPEKMTAPCLTDDQILEIADLTVRLEKHFGCPQDVEWALDASGELFILQSRPLKVQEGDRELLAGPPVELGDREVIIKGRGLVVQKGAAAGTVYICSREEDLEEIPRGAVLVARTDSSRFVRVMPRLAAIVTDTGTVTSHMASLAREFRLPTAVNLGDATQVLKPGRTVTLSADADEGVSIYDGVVRELVDRARAEALNMESLYEYRKKRSILRYISTLNLVDPMEDSFTPERCKSLHDVLRFMHEKSMQELIDEASRSSSRLKGQAAVRLELPVPTGIIVLDIGEGLSAAAGKSKKVGPEQVTSLPLKAVIEGLCHPGVWHSDMVSFGAGDLLSGMARMGDITTLSANTAAGYNVAVASREYVNMSLRFGYHFNMLDCYCSQNARNNHIYFRFVGGAASLEKRSRRILLISEVLKESGFNVKTKGDLVVARLANMGQAEMLGVLNRIGRLVSFTRQLDTALQSDEAAERYAKNFLAGNYEI
jgi:pyruvate,water dikinase